ncbi:hypothetical protein [Sandaracinobacteroides saxicola]|uniref:Uncharacterized protein n=1 Tax=Sandaracinobacteroides saxicola TaxID=2759707 RepID=A0A7G5IFS9_9SPHN|nr:hypothetical protein [Sandaracinobacteroides saxicola]QMW22221.1 hypothetical protein H3309_12730 [Sandaracinobacteroides saxicola]
MSSPRSSAQRRYLKRFGISTICYVLTLALASRLIGQGQAEGPLLWLLAMLPGLSLVGVFWAIARLLLEETDEYQRLLLVRQSLVASGFALSIATVWGFLENFRLVPHIDSYWVAILWFTGLGLGSIWNRMTLGRGDRA